MNCNSCGNQLFSTDQKYCAICGISFYPNSTPQVSASSQSQNPESDIEEFEYGYYALGSDLKCVRLWDGNNWLGPVITDSKYSFEVLALVDSLHSVPPRYAGDSATGQVYTAERGGTQTIGSASPSVTNSDFNWQESSAKSSSTHSNQSQCVRCAAVNPFGSQFCTKCAMPLNGIPGAPTYMPRMQSQAMTLQNQFAWLLALTPIFYTVFDLIMWQNFNVAPGNISWLIYFGFNTLLAKLDERELERCGVDLQFWLGAFIVPYYLWKRAKLTDGNQAYLIVWVVSMLVNLAFIA